MSRLDRAIIDEVQRVPQLLLALKFAVDQDRRPGRFLLTGSANTMALPQIADSLAGRIETLTPLPLSQSELDRRPNDFMQQAQSQSWQAAIGAVPQRMAQELQVLSGGYPEMRQRTSFSRKQAWARAYMDTLVQRDIQDIAHIHQGSQVVFGQFHCSGCESIWPLAVQCSAQRSRQVRQRNHQRVFGVTSILTQGVRVEKGQRQAATLYRFWFL